MNQRQVRRELQVEKLLDHALGLHPADRHNRAKFFLGPLVVLLLQLQSIFPQLERVIAISFAFSSVIVS